jgi:hypothetical protein
MKLIELQFESKEELVKWLKQIKKEIFPDEDKVSIYDILSNYLEDCKGENKYYAQDLDGAMTAEKHKDWEDREDWAQEEYDQQEINFLWDQTQSWGLEVFRCESLLKNTNDTFLSMEI